AGEGQPYAGQIDRRSAVGYLPQDPRTGDQGSGGGGQVAGGDAEGVEEGREHLGRCRRLPRNIPAQVRIELAVGEVPGDPVRPVHGQRALADPGRAGE
ncbi:hypothetical protein E1258_32120, partial [Micromonospora sp. KC207]